MREVLVAAVFLLPASRFKNRVLRAFGHVVDPAAHIAPTFVLHVGRMEIGRCRVGVANQFRGLELVRLEDDVIVGNFNTITSAGAFRGYAPDTCRLVMRRASALTNRHHLDCSGGITVGEFSIVSGMHSDLLTHGIDDVDDVQDCAPIVIGHHARLGSDNRVAMGAHLPDRSITAMGAVVLPGLDQPGQLYAGMPAVARKPVSGRWFTRQTAVTPVRPPAATVPPSSLTSSRSAR